MLSRVTLVVLCLALATVGGVATVGGEAAMVVLVLGTGTLAGLLFGSGEGAGQGFSIEAGSEVESVDATQRESPVSRAEYDAAGHGIRLLPAFTYYLLGLFGFSVLYFLGRAVTRHLLG